MRTSKIKLIPVVSCALALLHMSPLVAAPGDILYEREITAETEAFPPAIFPHWKHRIHYRCDACHDSLFKMKKGSTPVTMEMISRGEVCGACHNGEVAFNDAFVNCARCHRAQDDG